MAKKKLSSLEDLGGFVFSTNDDFELENNSVDETCLLYTSPSPRD